MAFDIDALTRDLTTFSVLFFLVAFVWAKFTHQSVTDSIKEMFDIVKDIFDFGGGGKELEPPQEKVKDGINKFKK